MSYVRGVFKRTATKISEAVQATGADVELILNPGDSKPKKGTFIMHVEGRKEPVVNIGPIPRPFTLLRNLDVDKVVESIVSA